MRKIRHNSQVLKQRRRANPLAVSESKTKTIGFVKKKQCYWDDLTDRYIKKLKHIEKDGKYSKVFSSVEELDKHIKANA